VAGRPSRRWWHHFFELNQQSFGAIRQHTDCGILRLQRQPAMLADYLRVEPDALPSLEVDDPRTAIEVDIAALRADSRLHNGLQVSGLIYDVATGQTDTVVAPAPLRRELPADVTSAP
jgi:carbonic anhydrase